MLCDSAAARCGRGGVERAELRGDSVSLNRCRGGYRAHTLTRMNYRLPDLLLLLRQLAVEWERPRKEYASQDRCLHDRRSTAASTTAAATAKSTCRRAHTGSVTRIAQAKAAPRWARGSMRPAGMMARSYGRNTSRSVAHAGGAAKSAAALSVPTPPALPSAVAATDSPTRGTGAARCPGRSWLRRRVPTPGRHGCRRLRWRPHLRHPAADLGLLCCWHCGPRSVTSKLQRVRKEERVFEGSAHLRLGTD